MGNVGKDRERTCVVEVTSSFDRSIAFGDGLGAGGVFSNLREPLESIGRWTNVESQIFGSGGNLNITPNGQMKSKPVRELDIKKLSEFVLDRDKMSLPKIECESSKAAGILEDWLKRN